MRPPVPCRTCSGLGHIPENTMCPGCVRLYGHKPSRRRVNKVNARLREDGERRVRRWRDRHNR